MKQFNLDEYLKNPSRKVVTRDGRNVKILCTNYYSCYSVIAEIEGLRFSNSFYPDGKFRALKDPSPNDLFFATEKHEGWINVFEDVNNSSSYVGSHIFKTKEDAEKVVKNYSVYKTTIKIEWEE